MTTKTTQKAPAAKLRRTLDFKTHHASLRDVYAVQP